ncbi:MAG: transglycosylase SLT domain-containing protein [Elusimicrobia bacterium]|nr:transglycosylase SLT domain-containing protein [Elusimicrobiota bacterium]
MAKRTVCKLLTFAALAFLCRAADAQAPLESASLGAKERSPLILAAAQTVGLDYMQLRHYYDAAAVRHQQAAPAPAPRAFAAPAGFDPAKLPSQPRKRWAPIVVPPPPHQDKAYRRTFMRLLGHPEKTDRFDAIILKHAQAYHLDPRLLKAIIAAESEFFFGARSPRGARGLMQVMPRTAKEMGVSQDRLTDPEFNIKAGARYLAHLFQRAWRRYKLKGVRFQNAPVWLKARIVAAYNAGPKFLYRDRWYRQTRDYVRKVQMFYRSRVTDFLRSTRSMQQYAAIPVSSSTGTLQ